MSSDGEEHERLARAAERLVDRIDPDFAGDLPAALDALTEGLPRGVDGMRCELKKRTRVGHCKKDEIDVYVGRGSI